MIFKTCYSNLLRHLIATAANLLDRLPSDNIVIGQKGSGALWVLQYPPQLLFIAKRNGPVSTIGQTLLCQQHIVVAFALIKGRPL